jgi:hypothetical protein
MSRAAGLPVFPLRRAKPEGTPLACATPLPQLQAAAVVLILAKSSAEAARVLGFRIHLT